MIMDRYELVELLDQDEERKTFKAQDVANSREVILHALKAQSSASQNRPALAELATHLFQSGRFPELLFAGEHEGTFYIVCEMRPGCRDIREWLEQEFSKESPRKKADDPLGKAGVWKVPSMNSPASEPESFTRVFNTPTTQMQPQQTTSVGDFTRMFQTPDQSPQTAPQSEATPNSGPGDFTRMFQAADPPSQPAPQPPAAQSSGPGDFTRMFQAPDAPAQPVPQPPPAPSTSPGDFTRMFQAPSKTEQPIPSPLGMPGKEPVKKVESGQFTRMFSTPAAPQPAQPSWNMPPPSDRGSTGIFAQPVEVQPALPSSDPNHPSEFTRVIAVPTTLPPTIEPPSSAAPVQSSTAPPAPAPPAPVTSTKSSYLPLILILNGLFVIAVLLILFFVLKK